MTYKVVDLNGNVLATGLPREDAEKMAGEGDGFRLAIPEGRS
jgi:hypothetical protein